MKDYNHSAKFDYEACGIPDGVMDKLGHKIIELSIQPMATSYKVQELEERVTTHPELLRPVLLFIIKKELASFSRFVEESRSAVTEGSDVSDSEGVVEVTESMMRKLTKDLVRRLPEESLKSIAGRMSGSALSTFVEIVKEEKGIDLEMEEGA